MEEGPVWRDIERDGQVWLHEQGRCRLLSLEEADVRGLTIGEVDLGPCRFAGAHNLDQLRIEPLRPFANAPNTWRTRRQTIAEEHIWRASQEHGHGWYPPSCRPTGEEMRPTPRGATEIAGLYRHLRKAREDSRDQPGAADFYYGEMEMRRHISDSPRAERLLIWLYWLVAGYGLRAWRALATLLVVLLLATGAVAQFGLPPAEPTQRVVGAIAGTPPNQTLDLEYQKAPLPAAAKPPLGHRLVAAALISVEGAAFRSSDPQLTPTGRYIQTVVRLLGPLLIGLALLSARGRIKR